MEFYLWKDGACEPKRKKRKNDVAPLLVTVHTTKSILYLSPRHSNPYIYIYITPNKCFFKQIIFLQFYIYYYNNNLLFPTNYFYYCKKCRHLCATVRIFLRVFFKKTSIFFFYLLVGNMGLFLGI